jgi:hypothetical protein
MMAMLMMAMMAMMAMGRATLMYYKEGNWC